MSVAKKPVTLALQGGGAHGAFTWGVLDRLLEEAELEVEGISATSAGAMNAAAFKHGLVLGGVDGAKEALEAFWMGLAGLTGPLGHAIADWLRVISPPPGFTARALALSPGVQATEAVTRVLSPYQFNPVNYHPLRPIVEDLLDLDAVCAARGPKLFICATNVRDGKPRVFQGKEISTDAILASACLPTLYQAIEIDDPAPSAGRPIGTADTWATRPSILFSTEQLPRISSSFTSTRCIARNSPTLPQKSKAVSTR